MDEKLKGYLKPVVRTLRNAADVIDDIAEERVTPATLAKAAECGVGVASSSVDSVLSFLAGMRKGAYAQSPMEMIGDIQTAAGEAVEEILAKQPK